MKDYYSILEVSKNASEETIRAAFKTLAKKYHPDSGINSDEKIKDILEAYETLSNSEKKIIYDINFSKASESNSQNTRRRESDNNAEMDHSDPIYQTNYHYQNNNILLSTINGTFSFIIKVLSYIAIISLIIYVISIFNSSVRDTSYNVIKNVTQKIGSNDTKEVFSELNKYNGTWGNDFVHVELYKVSESGTWYMSVLFRDQNESYGLADNIVLKYNSHKKYYWGKYENGDDWDGMAYIVLNKKNIDFTYNLVDGAEKEYRDTYNISNVKLLKESDK